MELGIVGLDGETCAELLDGVVEIGLLEIGDSEVFAECSAVRREFERREIEGNRALGVT